MMMNPLPNIETAFNLLSQQERQMNQDADESKVLLNTSLQEKKKPKGKYKDQNLGQNKNSKSGSYSNKSCTYCGRIGHIAKTCYRKHGFPAHLKKNSSANNCVADEDSTWDSEDDSNSQEGAVTTDEPTLELSLEQKKAIIAILQQSSGNSGHSINQIKTKGNASKQMSSKSNQQVKETQGKVRTLLLNYKAS